MAHQPVSDSGHMVGLTSLGLTTFDALWVFVTIWGSIRLKTGSWDNG